jgi:Cytochrome c7 and related cytochrome c
VGERSGSRFLRFWWLLAIVGVLIVVAAAIFISQRAALAAPEQPIAFSHNLHDEAGIQCLFCHTSPMRSDVAGIPSVQRCVGCHGVIATDRSEVQTVLGYWEREEPIPWQRVIEMPDYVFFSHQPHLLAGLSCETCHGDVGQMSVARPTVDMDMGWCLSCHLEQPEEKVARLADCMACHK